jgi:hypothetical protein
VARQADRIVIDESRVLADALRALVREMREMREER